MKRAYADSWSHIAQPCDIDLLLMEYEDQHDLYFMVYDFVFYLEDYLIYEYES